MTFPALVLFCLAATAELAIAADTAQTCGQASRLHQAGDFVGAIQSYEECLKLKQDSAELWSDFGAALAHEGRFQESISRYRKALSIDGSNPRLRYNLVLAYYKLGDLSHAVEELLPLHQSAPQQMQVTLLLADCYLRLGRMQDVIQLLSPLEADHRSESGFAYLLGMALIRKSLTRIHPNAFNFVSLGLL